MPTNAMPFRGLVAGLGLGLCLAVALALPSAYPVAAQEPVPGTWEVTPLFGGPVYDLLVEPESDPLLPTQRIVAAGQDVLQSTQGVTWTLVGGLPGAYNVVGSGGSWLVSTRDGTGYMHGRGGTVWLRSNLRDPDDAVRFLGAAPSFDENGLAFGVTTDDLRLYRTNSRGSRWADVVVVRGAEVEAGAVAFSPLYVTDETVFAGTDRGIFVSTDSGQTWVLRAAAGAGVPAFGLAAGPVEYQGLRTVEEWGDDPRRKRDPDVRTLFAWNASGVWRSDDDAVTWSRLDVPAAVSQVRDLAVSPGWPNDRALLVAASGDGLVGVASSDGGATWRTVAGTGGIAGTSAAMARDFVIIPPKDPFPPIRSDSQGNEIYLPFLGKYAPYPFPRVVAMPVHREMYLATDGEGVWRSEDDGRSWDKPIATQHNAQPESMVALGNMDDLLAGTTTSGLFRSSDGAQSWRRVDGLPRGDGQVIARLRTSPAFASDRTVLAAAASGLWVSKDAGTTWARTSHPATLPVRSVAFSPDFATDRTLLSDGHLSTDGGQTWAPVTGATDRPWRAVAFSPRFATDRRAWAGTDVVDSKSDNTRGLWASTDGGATWVLHEKSDLANVQVFSLTAIAVTASEDVRVFAGTSGGVFRSEDGGATWRRINLSGVGIVRDLAGLALTQPFQTAVIVGASSTGPIWSTDRGATWTRDARAPADLHAVVLGTDGRTLRLAGYLSSVRGQLPPLGD